MIQSSDIHDSLSLYVSHRVLVTPLGDR